MKINMPQAAQDIINTLTEHGYEAYIVGGCVRDVVLGRQPEDWDITTSAPPLTVKNLFRRTVDTGLKHGTVTVMLGKTGYEVTTYRIDGEYRDGRHPDSVEFTANLLEDLKRRDFTINSMAYNDKEGIVDAFNGLGDIERKVVRCVGNASHRFTEDALRMMRAIRFSAQLSFDIEEDTGNAVRKLSHTISKVSAERIQTELTKTLCSGHPDYVFLFEDYGLSPYILPVLDRLTKAGKRELSKRILLNLPSDTVLRYAALLYDEGESEAEKVLRELRFDNRTVSAVSKLAMYAKLPLVNDEAKIRKNLNICGPDIYEKLLLLREAISIAVCEDTQIYEDIRSTLNMIFERGDCYSLSMLKFSGKDLIAMGIKDGKQIGYILNVLLDEVIEHPEKNDFETLKAMAKCS